LELPQADRTVQPYVYLATATESQAHLTLDNDKGITSDEYIFQLAEKKDVIMKQLKSIMQSAAVDCKLHSEVHGVECVRPNINARDNAYEVKMVHDLKDNELQGRKKKISLKSTRLDGILYSYDSSGVIYDYNAAHETPASLVIVGKFKKNKEGKTEVHLNLKKGPK
jgi:hypothetical protein